MVGGGEVLSVNLASDDSSDVKESDKSVPLFGVEVLNGSPTFSLENVLGRSLVGMNDLGRNYKT